MNRKLCVVFVALAIVMFASSAFAGLMMHVVALPGPGYSVSPDGKGVLVMGPSAMIQMQVWATVQGQDTDHANEALQTIAGGIGQTHVQPSPSALSLTDATTKGYLAPFDTLKASAVNVTPDLLGTAGATTQTGALAYRASALIPGEQFILGTFNFQAAPQPGTNGVFSAINWVKAGAYLSGATFKIDGVTKNGGATSGYPLIDVGQPVQVAAIPEPSTIILLGMGALALVFIRRRK